MRLTEKWTRRLGNITVPVIFPGNFRFFFMVTIYGFSPLTSPFSGRVIVNSKYILAQEDNSKTQIIKVANVYAVSDEIGNTFPVPIGFYYVGVFPSIKFHGTSPALLCGIPF